MNICVFCRGPADTDRREHILPESLGGGDWACAPPHTVCAVCNQYFGAKVERRALDSFPFLALRVLLGIPTKRGRPATMETTLGTLRGSLSGGKVGIDPATPALEEAISHGRVTQVRLLAEPTEPLSVCRLLLKMAIEVIAADSVIDALDERYDDARHFARRPRPGSRWWFLIHADMQRIGANLQHGVVCDTGASQVELSVHVVDGAEVFQLAMLGMHMQVPLLASIWPGDDVMQQAPTLRVFHVAA